MPNRPIFAATAAHGIRRCCCSHCGATVAPRGSPETSHPRLVRIPAAPFRQACWHARPPLLDEAPALADVDCRNLRPRPDPHADGLILFRAPSDRASTV